MQKIISIIFMTLVLAGCNFLPKLNFSTPNTVPQAIDRAKAKDSCKGGARFNEQGEMIYCSKGYSAYAENYSKAERRMTIVERVRSFFNKLFSWGLPGLLIICVLCPTAFTFIGTIIGRFFEGAYGAASITLKRVSRAVQNNLKRKLDLKTALDAELDDKNKKYIRKLKDKEKIK